MTYNKAILSPADPGEEPFSIDEIFFSRTDKRGVIRSGNEVFRRVSGFEWDRLIGAPHRVVRHPDMPKAAFWLLWKTIQSDKPMIAFVKNKSASGRWYWVLAVVVPFAEGYLSARIKPTGALFGHAKALYAEVLAAEQTLSPDKSAELLLARLADLGFPTYDDFAAKALEQELALRDAALGITNSSEARILATVGTNLKAMREKQSVLMQEFDALQSIPTNMRIIASRLEPSGGPISAISDNYKFSSTEISRRLDAFAGSGNNLCQAMADIVRDALLISAIARLLSNVRKQFANEDRAASPVRVEEEEFLLTSIASRYHDEARAAMAKAESVSGELSLSSGEIRRMMLGLDTIRVMGRVESGRLGATGVGLSATIDQLDTRHASIAELLQSLMDLSATIKAGINSYQRQSVS
jgi:PAS domain S-box-containing protein